MPELTLAESSSSTSSARRHGQAAHDRDAARAAPLRHGAFGDVPLRDLERMSGEIASGGPAARAVRYGDHAGVPQTLEAAVRWGYMRRNPAKLAGRTPSRRRVRCARYTVAEVEAIAAELSPAYPPLPVFAAATGLRPEEWRR